MPAIKNNSSNLPPETLHPIDSWKISRMCMISKIKNRRSWYPRVGPTLARVTVDFCPRLSLFNSVRGLFTFMAVRSGLSRATILGPRESGKRSSEKLIRWMSSRLHLPYGEHRPNPTLWLMWWLIRNHIAFTYAHHMADPLFTWFLSFKTGNELKLQWLWNSRSIRFVSFINDN